MSKHDSHAKTTAEYFSHFFLTCFSCNRYSQKTLPSCRKHSPHADTPLVQTLPSFKLSPRTENTPLVQKTPPRAENAPLVQKTLPSCRKHSPHTPKNTPLVRKTLPLTHQKHSTHKPPWSVFCIDKSFGMPRVVFDID